MKQIPIYKFHKHKYGTELLIDVLELDYIKTGIRRNPVHRETFYCLILITGGQEEITINEHTRLVQAGDGQPMNDISANRYVDGFIHAVEAEYMMRHEVEYYADKLCITPNYLNKIVRQSLGMTAKAYIRQKLFTEARRLLSYTILSVKETAEWLHFDSASHFVRFFRRHADMTPLQYRQSINSPQK